MKNGNLRGMMQNTGDKAEEKGKGENERGTKIAEEKEKRKEEKRAKEIQRGRHVKARSHSRTTEQPALQPDTTLLDIHGYPALTAWVFQISKRDPSIADWCKVQVPQLSSEKPSDPDMR
ncbi:hypothetical protein T265_11125 [Opisthorchis viverrini]|uniref:Uncharacterized protein n=1 Tax=Opisthorchis viverrini TaxID=6198 RepID=A0A074Z048_OPIVI|nr:hypothetical protein T265_11125 [Opisthorchis viverrini]KER20293.1 hypothetical protein T265_11125 [Opisthorchis viverrini]